VLVAPRGLPELVASLFPGARVRSVSRLGPDVRPAGVTAKAGGYGAPLRVLLDGAPLDAIVVRTATANDFGHDRRSDRAAAALLAYDSFGEIPDHVRALDVGAIRGDGRLSSLRDAGELYLVTTWTPGALYAEDLRRIARDGTLADRDLARCEALARWLVALHAQRGGRPATYLRAVRDLVGSGEGIFGVIDNFPRGTAAAPPSRLAAIERRCVGWRARLRGKESRLARTHGDFHPFNIVFDPSRGDAAFTLLDASRGVRGDPADDVTCLAINYLFFALDRPASWRSALSRLWGRFWSLYLDESRDGELLDVAAPFFAWRGLVLSNPLFYPTLPARARDALLGLVERALEAPRFDPTWAGELFA
jgi:hypothetical protein